MDTLDTPTVSALNCSDETSACAAHWPANKAKKRPAVLNAVWVLADILALANIVPQPAQAQPVSRCGIEPLYATTFAVDHTRVPMHLREPEGVVALAESFYDGDSLLDWDAFLEPAVDYPSDKLTATIKDEGWLKPPVSEDPWA